MPSPIRKGQLESYLAYAEKEKAYPLIYVGLQSGLWQSDLISLPWAAVNLSKKCIKTRTRIFELDEKSCELIAAEREQHPDSKTVFVHPRTNQAYQRHQLFWLHTKLCRLARLPEIGFKELQVYCKEALK